MNYSITIETRSNEEKEWWNRFSDVMSMQWELNPLLNKVLRNDLVDDYTTYLYKNDGWFLDVGCGNGWISIHFASLGMNVIGIDFSKEQIRQAKKKGREVQPGSLAFKVMNVVNADVSQFQHKFDSIMVNAFLHHLSNSEIRIVLGNLEKMLKKDGKVYLYEPIRVMRSTEKRWLTLGMYYFIRYIISILFYRPIHQFKLETPYCIMKRRQGYSGISPHEAPVGLSAIFDAFSDSIELKEIMPWHSFSLAYGMELMVLKAKPQKLYALFAPLVYKVEKLLLQKLDWQVISEKAFVMCGIKIKKN